MKSKKKEKAKTSAKEYSTDATVLQALATVNAKISLHELYGLFYGCVAATNLVPPSKYTPMIFDQEEMVFASTKEAERVMGNFLSLWSTIASWNPKGSGYFYPDISYPMNAGGLLQRMDDMSAFIQYFMKGLDLGDTAEEDFSDDAMDALHMMAEASVLLANHAELYEKAPPESTEGEPGKTAALLDRMEGMVIDGVARVTAELKAVRIQFAQAMDEPMAAPKPARYSKIGRNDLCPCGSGKKYKKCCMGSA